MARRRIVPVAIPPAGALPGDGGTPPGWPVEVVEVPMPIVRAYVAPYDLAFRRQAIRMVHERALPASVVARDLGISSDTLRDWMAQARHDRQQLKEVALPEATRTELVRLRAEVRRLEEQVAILRDALAIMGGRPMRGPGPRRGRRTGALPVASPRGAMPPAGGEAGR